MFLKKLNLSHKLCNSYNKRILKHCTTNKGRDIHHTAFLFNFAKMSVPILNEEEVEKYLPTPKVCVDFMKDILCRYSKENGITEEIIQPVRSTIRSTERESAFYAMPCFLKEENVYCVKSLFLGPATENLEHCSSLITLTHGTTGKPLIIMEGAALTDMRTAAVSAAASLALADENSRILTIFGSGRLARTHFEIHNAVMNITEVRIWNIRSESGLKFVNELKAKGVNAVWMSDAKLAVANADIVCLVTSSKTPIFDVDWVKDGAHINAVGACSRYTQEIFPSTMNQAVVYVDSRDAAKTESGDIIKSGVEIYGEIGEAIRGTKESFRKRKTIFKSLGMAVEDAKLAYYVHREFKRTALPSSDN